MWRIIIGQSGGKTQFGFNEMSDALNFAGMCAECGDKGTIITILEEEEEEED